MLSFRINPRQAEILLQSNLSDARPTTPEGYQWWGEVYTKAAEGRITGNTINIDAYGRVCTKNEMLKNLKREVALVSSSEMEEGNGTYYPNCVADTVANYVDSNIDEIFNRYDVDFHINEFLKIQNEILINDGVNFFQLILSTLKSETNKAGSKYKKQQAKLVELSTKYDLKEILTEVLTNQSCFKKIKGILA